MLFQAPLSRHVLIHYTVPSTKVPPLVVRLLLAGGHTCKVVSTILPLLSSQGVLYLTSQGVLYLTSQDVLYLTSQDVLYLTSQGVLYLTSQGVLYLTSQGVLYLTSQGILYYVPLQTSTAASTILV